MTKRLVWMAVVAAMAVAPATAADRVSLNGYAEWRHDGLLVVDGQRVRAATPLRFKGRGEARDFASIPLGYEVKVEGERDASGVVLARKVEARPNGEALFEAEVAKAFEETEERFRRRGRVFDEDDHGHITEDYGRLLVGGPQVERARATVRRLVPAYLDADDFRVYVVDNPDWNAMAAPNRSIYVFTGLLENLDDDELAIILGHELAHATHEHGCKSLKDGLWKQLLGLGIAALAEEIDNGAARTGIQAAALLGTLGWTNGYGRKQEDQADRVGLRYAFEAGYDVSRAPALWERFARKYGNGNAVVSFFLSDHSRSRTRARNLEREIAFNYGKPGEAAWAGGR